MDSSPAQEACKWIKMEDMDTVMTSNPSYKDIIFSDSKTKVLDLISSMQNLKTLKIFLQSFDVNTTLPSDSPLWPGSTPLHLAVIFSESMKNVGKASNLIRQFLDQGASVQVQDNRGATPVHLAFCLNQQHVVAVLLRKLELKSEKVSNLLDKENLSYLHIALCTGNDHRYSLARKLLDQEGIHNTVNTAYNGEDLDKLKKGWTPLHVAVDLSQFSLARLLLQKGASKVCPDARGCTPIHLLIGSIGPESKSFAEELFSELELKESVVEDTRPYLFVAVWLDDANYVKRLLDLGANIDSKVEASTENLQRFNGSTPLLLAMIMKHYRIINILIERGADLLAKKSDGTTPVSIMLTTFYSDTAKTMLRLIFSDDNLQKRLKDDLGLTMLHIACYSCDVDKVQKLLDKGHDVNDRIPDYFNFWAGYTPLHVLVASKYYYYTDVKTLATLQKLVQSGCDIDLQDSIGKTPLHLAVEKRKYEITHKLLLVGADVNVLDYNGKSPISYALELFIHQRTRYHRINTAHSLILHTYKMKLVGMEVQNELSESLQTIVLKEDNVTLKFPNESEFCDQVQATEKIKIGKRGLSLRSFLHETGAISLYPSLTPMDRKELDVLFQSFDEKKFPDLSPWLKTQYRKAITRLPLIEPASDALKNLISSGFPDLCVDLILKYLSNSQLRQLITAAPIENTVT